MRTLALAALLASPLAAQPLVIPSDAGAPVGVCALEAALEHRAGAKALVVYVHGSGPQDRDEGGLFKGLSKKLGRRGIASLRYDKRSVTDACKPALRDPGLSPEHFLADVVSVMARAEQEGLPVFLLGHSEGVTYVDELASRAAVRPAGVILLAGLGRHALDEAVLRQLRDAVAAAERELAKPDLPEAWRREIARSKAEWERDILGGEEFFARMRAGTLRDDERYFGAYARFWREEIAMTARAAPTAAFVDVPALLMQGSADRNVLEDDFRALAAALPDVTPHWLEGLEHMFFEPGTRKVDSIVPALIADWIDARLASERGAVASRAAAAAAEAAAR